MKLDDNHWRIEDCRQRITTKEWKELLLDYADHVIFKGRMRQLRAKKVGPGVYEIYKEPLKDA